MDMFEYLNATPIELLGYAMNNIVEAASQAENLPCRYKSKLRKAYILLYTAQEYLYKH